MVASVRVAGAHVDISANAGPYQAGVGRAIAANRQFAVSFTGLGPAIDRFRTSVTSSLIATAAYATGVGALSRGIGGSVRNFIDFERGLVGVQKTAGLTGRQTQVLGEGIRRLVTEMSSLGRPLPVTRDALQDIAVVAGQMGITGTRNILRFTETVGLLTLTTDLAGDAAANAIGKILETTEAGVEQVDQLGSSLTALGNAFRGGEADILGQANFLATQTATFRLPTQDILAYSAALAAGGQRAETAGTAFNRLFQVLTDSAAEAGRGNITRLAAIVAHAGDQTKTLEERVETLRDALISGDYRTGLLTFLEALRNAGPEGAGSIFTALFGGQRPPTRLAGVFGFLARNIDQVNRALRISNEEWDRNRATQEEALIFARTVGKRYETVGEQISDDSIAVGRAIATAFLPVAENFETVAVSAAALAATLATSFGRRRIARIRETVAATRAAAVGEQRAARAAADAANRRARARAAEFAVIQQTGAAQQTYIRAQRRLSRADERAISARQRLAAANRVVAASQVSLTRRLGRGLLNVFGGAPGLIIGGITALTFALPLLARRQDEATQATIRNLEALERQNAAAQNAAAGVTPDEARRNTLREDRARLLEELASIRRQIARERSESAAAGGPSVVSQGLLDRQAELEDLLTRINTALNEGASLAQSWGDRLLRAASDAARALDRIVPSFRQFNQQLELVPHRFGVQVRNLEQQLAQSNLRNALEIDLFGQDSDQAIRRRLEQQFRFEDDRRILAAQNAAEIARRELGIRRAALRDAELQVNIYAQRGQLETDIGKRAQNTVSALKRQIVTAELLVNTREREVEYAKAVSQEISFQRNQQIIIAQQRAGQARRDRAAQDARRNIPAFRDPIVDSGVAARTAAARATQDFTRSIEVRIETTRRALELDERALTLGERAAAGLRGRAEIQNQFAVAQRRANENLVAAQRRRADAVALVGRLESRLADANREQEERILGLIDAAQVRAIQANQDVARARAETRAYNELGGAIDVLAERYGRLAEQRVRSPLQQIADQAQSLNDILENVTARGLTSLEDALVNTFRTGRLEVGQLAAAIATDLISALVRTIVTANLARAALSIFGFGGGGGGFLGGGVGRVPIGFGHSGGIVGRLPPRPQAPLRPNERFAILEAGEEILTRRDPRHRYNWGYSNLASINAFVRSLPRYHDGGVVGGASGRPGMFGASGRVEVHVRNDGSVPPIAAEVERADFDAEGAIIGLLIKAGQDNTIGFQGLQRLMLQRR